MGKVHIPTYYENRLTKKLERGAYCSDSIIDCEVSKDPRKITCKNCRKKKRVDTKIHYRPTKHGYRSRDYHKFLRWLATINKDKVTCDHCKIIYGEEEIESNIEASSSLNLEVRTDDRDLIKKIRTLSRFKGNKKSYSNYLTNLTMNDLFFLFDIELTVKIDARTHTKKWKIDSLLKKREEYLKSKKA